MTKVRDVIEVMESWAPSSLAETWDNVGLITGEVDHAISSVMITLDVTVETIAQARKNHVALIITHHPPIMKPLKNLTGEQMSSRAICMAIREDISIYTSHTNLDRAPEGVSATLAHKLGLTSVSPLSQDMNGLIKFVVFTPPEYTDRVREAAGSAGAGIIGNYNLCSFTSRGLGTYIPSSVSQPYEGEAGKLSRVPEDRIEMIVHAPFIAHVIEETRKVHPYEEMAYDLIPLSNPETSFGYGAIGNLQQPMEHTYFPEYVSRILNVKSLTVSEGKGNLIKRIGVMGGSGKSYIQHAVKSGADAYITGDLGYHDYMEYGRCILLIDASHRATELPVLDKIQERLLTSGIGEKIDIILDAGKVVTTMFDSNTLP
ncbi:MAG TPA: Nif3-like dinuclear metal center hexameric protein [Anaerolineae bacterium]|nr:Nif3-like dinuclear metal center hexameric protein [Anaerolineae bacterium]